MSDSEPAPVFFFDDEDPEMQQAYEQARKTFRYFWRELAWEQRRIIPGLDVACVKAAFFDQDGAQSEAGGPQAEQMWISDVVFDGKAITGTLINSPQWITSVAEGDEVRMQVGGISDWMYAIQGRVYGAFTVNLMRSRMDPAERAAHDEAWGLEFGDPRAVQVVPDGDASLNFDHPMAVNMGQSLAEHLNEDPGNVHQRDDNGWTFLHQLALAGSTTSVAVLLKHGADPNAVTSHGMTPLQLANSLGWTQVAELLAANGARS